jgi:hypothetical protein
VSKSAVSLFVFGVYMFIVGLIMLVIPNFFLSLVGIPTTTEIWIRMAGMLIFILSFYYMISARWELKQFFLLSVYGRGSLIVFVTIFVLMGLGKPVMILFGFFDLLGAIWTALALRSEKSE